jgi:adenylate kinase
MTVVIVTGTPATGKTTLAKHIAKDFGFRRIDVGPLIKSKHLSEGYDKRRLCEIVDTDKLVSELTRLIVKSGGRKLVIDSHLSHYLPADYVDICLVTKCDLKELKRRLERRYDVNKVRENLDAEIFDICYNEAKEFGHNVQVVDTTRGINIQELKKLLKSFLIRD